jgi:hypothetical protein
MGREIDRQQEINSNYYRSKDSKVMVHAKTIIKRAMNTHCSVGKEGAV